MDLEAEVSASLTWHVVVEARLGPLGTTWEQPHLSPDANGTLRVTLEPPKEAFLDDLALEYVTDLRVLLEGYDDAGRIVSVVSAPPAFLAWPDGVPVVWDLDTMQAEAPAGVTSAVLRADLGSLEGIDRVGPPLEPPVPPPSDVVDTGVTR